MTCVCTSLLSFFLSLSLLSNTNRTCVPLRRGNEQDGCLPDWEALLQKTLTCALSHRLLSHSVSFLFYAHFMCTYLCCCLLPWRWPYSELCCILSSLVSSFSIVSPSSCAIVIQNAANVCANHFLVMDFLLGIKQDQISAGVRHR